MYDRIQAIREPGGIRVRLHAAGDRTAEDFIYELGGNGRSIESMVERLYGTPHRGSVEVVSHFDHERI